MPTRELENLYKSLLMWAKILAFFGLSSCAVPPDGRVAIGKDSPDGRLSVLFVGNSYSFGVPAEFGKLARSRGKNVRIGHSTHGGWQLSQYMEHSPTLKKIREGSWDVVVLQDHSLNPGKPESERQRVMDPAVRFLADEARANGAIPVLYQTWGRRDGEPGVEGDDFFKMNERVRQGYRDASEQAGGILVVPAGDAWEKEHLAGRGADLYTEDGSHPSAYGDKVTARVFYEALFSE